jgi:GntR family transcriptional regulator
MDFNSSQTIYMQIVDWVSEQILTGIWKPGDKAKSVRELAVLFEVNPNTVMRSYELLQNNGIIANKRGIGFFVTENAVEIITSLQKKQFLEEDVPVFVKKMKLLNIDLNEIINLYNQQN